MPYALFMTLIEGSERRDVGRITQGLKVGRGGTSGGSAGVSWGSGMGTGTWVGSGVWG